ncbi:unnamed protein product, partial [Pylaiella littoralis]
LKVCLRKNDQREDVTCDQNVWSDKDTCKHFALFFHASHMSRSRCPCCSPARITRT